MRNHQQGMTFIGLLCILALLGVVVYAGWLGGYGRLVEIDHGLGVAFAAGPAEEPGHDLQIRRAVGVAERLGLETRVQVLHQRDVGCQPVVEVRSVS